MHAFTSEVDRTMALLFDGSPEVYVTFIRLACLVGKSASVKRVKVPSLQEDVERFRHFKSGEGALELRVDLLLDLGIG